MLESLSAYEVSLYNPKLLDLITARLSQLLNDTNIRAHCQNQTLTSIIKSYKLCRFPHHPVLDQLTDLVIEKLKAGTADSQLLSFAINRLGFLNEKENMLRLHSEMIESGKIRSFNQPQNIVMYLHPLAIHQIYDNENIKNAWIPLMKQLLCSDISKYDRESQAFNKALALTLELFQIDNP